MKFRTPQQEHDFGHPYQLGHLEAADKPDESMLMTLPVSDSPVAWPVKDSLQCAVVGLGARLQRRGVRSWQQWLPLFGCLPVPLFALQMAWPQAAGCQASAS